MTGWVAAAVAAVAGCAVLLLVAASPPGALPAEASDTPAPELVSPVDGLRLPAMGFTLNWLPVAGATQYHVQVTPFNNDGPGVNLILGPETTLSLPVPNATTGPFILLPDMSYRWRVRASVKAEFAPEADPSWGAWSEERTFRTPAPPPTGLRLVEPADGASVGVGGVRLRWSHTDASLFYWEVQVSATADFDTNPATATSFVWWNLVHGGVSQPRSSWITPPLPVGTYYWRVRPRVQGDGLPVAWSATRRFVVSAAVATATPTRTPSVTPTPTVMPTPMPTPGPQPPIVFESNRSGNFEVYSARPDGSGVTRLTSDSSHDLRPVWSPDGTKLAFISGRDGGYRLYLMNADGSEVKSAGPVEHFAWSPDGTKIALCDPTEGIRILRSDASVYRVLAEGGVYNGFAGIAWSSDSRRLAVSRRSGSDPNHEIAVYDWSSGVTSTVIAVVGDNREPRFQVGRYRVTFVSDRGGSYDIWDANDKGEGLVGLARGAGAESEIAWSPRGDRLLFVRMVNGNADVWVVNADGTGERNLTDHPAQDTNPAWSPDGSRILFTSTRDGNPEVYVMNADGSSPQNLTNDPAIDRNPGWKPK